jgi:hypothetical protein
LASTEVMCFRPEAEIADELIRARRQVIESCCARARSRDSS